MDRHSTFELDSGLEFDPERDEEFFGALPAAPGVLLFEMREASAHPYLARTSHIRRAAERLLRPPEGGSKRLNLRPVTARLRYRTTGSKFEQSFTFYCNARERFPHKYRELARLRSPAMLKVNLRNEYPRCYATRGLRADDGFYFGPFASRRAADEFAEGFLDLFKTRRCQIKIRRDPDYPGCIYSEMKMCLAPCFGGCTGAEYSSEVERLLKTLETRGAWLKEHWEREREAASAALRFEEAAAIHKRLEKASAALWRLPEIARRIEHLDAVILQRGAEEKCIMVFPVRGGTLGDPISLNFAELSSQPHSVEAFLRHRLEPEIADVAAQSGGKEPPPSARGEQKSASGDWREGYGLRSAPGELPEHLALIARWFYSKPREGEIFFREKDWPYRRILRACNRLLQAERNDSDRANTQPCHDPAPKFNRE